MPAARARPADRHRARRAAGRLADRRPPAPRRAGGHRPRRGAARTRHPPRARPPRPAVPPDRRRPLRLPARLRRPGAHRAAVRRGAGRAGRRPRGGRGPARRARAALLGRGGGRTGGSNRPGPGPRRGAHGRGLRCLGLGDLQRWAALPAPLPGGARGGGVPAAVRGRDGGDRPARRHARAAAGHDRPRRRGVHHAHPGAGPPRGRRGPHPRGEHIGPRAPCTGRAWCAPAPRRSAHRTVHQQHPHERPGEDARMTSTQQSVTGTPLTQDEQIEQLGRYQYGWADADVAGSAAKRGLSEDVVRDISARKNEPEWMLERRLKALKLFGRKPMPDWGSDLSGIDFQNIKYFVRSTEAQATSWEELPEDIKNTYDRLGIPEAEKQRLVAGVAAQYESEVVYHKIREDLEEQGVVFLDTDTALKEHEDLFREYFGSVIPSGDNKFAALNTAVWSGGSFIYVPKGVHVEIPLQAYFRINTENMGQFERTLIIVDEGAYVHYVEGCTAPIYKSDSLHSAVVEIIVKKNARCRYTTIQNWSNNVYNLV
ncbi:MAG: Fe-S cluster assembly protein SufB, partial [Actinomycetota bacterium]|nr:Fe-S cluster assembly protein SufB [Actinomycetota bacterium]